MKKVIALLLCVVLAASCFVGCKKKAPAPQAQEQVSFEGQKLVVYTDLTEGDAAHTAYMEQVTKFCEKTGAQVEVLCFGDQLDQARKGAIEAGKTVDVYKVASLDDFRFEVSDTLNLTPYADASDILSHVYPAYMEQIKLFSDDGTAIHGLPVTEDVTGMWYSTEAFEKAGVSAPTTVQEFETVCEKLKSAGYSPVVLETQNAAWNFAVHMERMLGEETAKNLIDNGGWAGDTNAVAAIQNLLDWAEKEYVAVVDWPLSWEAMGKTAAMTYTGSKNFAEYEGLVDPDLTVDCFSYPADKGSNGMSFDCGAWCVSANSQVGDLAWDYLYFMTTGEADAAISAAADAIPCDRGNANGTYASAVNMLASASGKLDHSRMLGDSDLADVAMNLYTGAYADGAEAAAALDALYQ